MSNAKQMLDTYPSDLGLDAGRLAAAIDACLDCTQSCTACADACLAEGDELLGSLRQCIRLNLDCSDVCVATLRILARQTMYDANVTRAQVEACVQVCRSCADECESHAGMHEHCRVNAEACRRCEQALSQLLSAMT